MLKIVQITTDNRNHFGHYSLPLPYFGTAPTGLLDGFADLAGIEVHVVSCANVQMNCPEKLADNIWFHQPLVSKMGWGKTLFQGCVRATRAVLREIEPDIVHGQGTERECAMAAVLSGYPNVLTIHGNMRVHSKRGENSKELYYKLAALLEGYCLKRTAGVVAISRYTQDLVKETTPRTWLLPNAVDRRYFQVEATPHDEFRILFVGSICERKNPIGLINACEPMLRSGKCSITFAGHGDESSSYWRNFRHLITTLPGLTLPGFLDRDALGREFSRSSLLVLPTYEDNCPMVVLEAMAAGLPVAASRVGGVPDLIEHEIDGLLFNPHDLSDIRACIERLIENPTLRASLAATGRTKARDRFHPRVIAEAHLDIYREILEA